jgi:NAD(P)-dependent dehydrogenase (short-subunit alcohol dehydrogenase family)
MQTKRRKRKTMGALAEKVAIVTGASAGIGRVIAERLAQNGGTVVVSYGKSADKAKAVVAGIESNGGKVLCDLAATMREVPGGRARSKPVRVPSKIKVLLGKRSGGRHL